MSDSFQQFVAGLVRVPEAGLTLDVSRMRVPAGWLATMEPAVQAALTGMAELEAGAVANPDEGRMVGHYWLRAPELAPTPALTAEIKGCLAALKTFVADVHAGRIRPLGAARFTRVLSIGIGGSALGPQFVADALGDPATDKMPVVFLDNTDPDGIARELGRLAGKLGETLAIVISKSGGTPETRNGMLLAAEAYTKAGLSFAKHAVAVTGAGSALDKTAVAEGWVARFPMWDWVGGRTSETSAVGLLPAALQGLDIDGLLAGAAAADRAGRVRTTAANPAAMMALMWHLGGEGRGAKDLVVLPYKDRLLLFSRYLQQLIMESLGKRLDLAGRRVDQGLSVYGNKGSTDQHAYVQQLRDGVANFFATFVRVLEDGGSPLSVEPGVTAGDYLHGFLLGTREALGGNDRLTMTVTVPRVDAFHVGALIALFERTVGIYARLVNINAYHQPGVEAGKKAAAVVLGLQGKLLAALSAQPRTAVQLAVDAGAPESAETAWLLLEHLSANGRARRSGFGDPSTETFVRV